MRRLLPVVLLAACATAEPTTTTTAALGIVDPLSMPAKPTVALDDVPSAETCKDCHPNQFAEWTGSRHAQSMTDPVFQGLVGVRQGAFHGVQDKFCVQCHTIAGVRSQDVSPGFKFADLKPKSMEGVTCWSCHGVQQIARLHNAGLTMAKDGAMRGNLPQPQTTNAHGTAEAPFLKTPEFCGACHEVVELSGLPLERPYSEWLTSPAAAKGQTCADCHMPFYTGSAAEGAEPRVGLRSHRFVGLDPPGAREAPSAELRAVYAAQRDALLASAADLTIAPGTAQPGERLVVAVTVQNKIAGHSLPTGSTFIRQCWLEMRAVDAHGKVLYETGTLDANGDLRDRWSALAPYADADLVSFSSGFIDPVGQPTLFPWLAAEHHRNQLRPGEQRTYSLFVPVPKDVAAPIQLTARLRLRTYPPFLLKVLGLDALLPDVILADLATDATAVNL